MYITITPQNLSANFSQSAADYVEYLEKENHGIAEEEKVHFFNQYEDNFSAEEVTKEIDSNTLKLKKSEPKFYSITVCPSKYELEKLTNVDQDLKKFTRSIQTSVSV